MKKIFLAVIGALVVLGVAMYLFVIRPLISLSENTQRVERALATPDLLILAGLNVKQAVALEKWFLGNPVISPAHATPVPEPPDRRLLDHLRSVNVDPRKHLEHAFYALYVSSGPELLRQAVILVGQFDPDTINQYLARELKGRKSEVSGHLTYEVDLTDPNTCQKSGTWAVTVDPRWILIADPVSTSAALLPRLTGAPKDTRADLGWWRAVARTDVVSLAIWDIEQAGNSLRQPILKETAKAAATEAGMFKRLYLGVGLKPVPPQGVVRLVLDAKDANRGTAKINEWAKAVRESRARWAATMPTVAALYDALKIHSEGATSTIEVTIDRKLVSDIQQAFNQLLSELLGALFGGISVQHGEGALSSTPPTERIDQNPIAFQPSVSAAELAPYDPKAKSTEDIDQSDVDQISGPFGVRLGALRLGTDPGVGLEVLVEAFSTAIPNVTGAGGETERARLFIDSLKSATGQELLREEDCGKERNNRPALFESLLQGLRARKTVRLNPGADPKTLKSVSGRIELHLPTKTETVTVSHPAPGTVIQKHGASFVITKVEKRDVSYQITGAKDNVLHYRALNSKGQPLASEGAFSANFLFGEGLSGQRTFAGLVDRVEIVFAGETKTLTFPFTLTDFSLSVPPSAFSDVSPPQFRPYSYQAMRGDASLRSSSGLWKQLPPPAKPKPAQAVVLLEPFELSLFEAKSFWQTTWKLDFKLRSPDLPNFQKAFTVGQLKLSRVRLKDGTVIESAKTAETVESQSSFATSWTKDLRFSDSPEGGVLSTDISLMIDPKVKLEQIKDLQGTLTFQFPKTLQTLRLDDLTVGQKAQMGDLTMTVTARGRKKLTLQANKDGHKVVYVGLYSAGGKGVQSFSPHITASAGGTRSFELSPLSPYTRAEVVLAGELDRKEYPFLLAVK